MLRPRAYSPSRLSDYERCPRYYYWRYVIHVPRKAHAARQAGILLHETLEKIVRAGLQHSDDPRAGQQMLADAWQVDAFPDEATARQELKTASTLLANHLERFRQAELLAEPVLLEARLKASIAGVPFVGVVDRVNRLQDGRLELLDYKSGTEGTERHSPGVLLQLAIYRELVHARTGRWPDTVSVLNLRSGSHPVELAPHDWEGHTSRAVRLAQALATEEDFNASPGPSCAHCDYASRCIPYMHWQGANQPAS